MSVLMFVVGALVAVVGLVLIAAGIPVKEFSFGNTLILAGTVAITGGFVVAGLGAVIAQLNRIADMLAARPATRTDRSLPPFDMGASRLGAGPGQIPFPPKTKISPVERSNAEPAFADTSENAAIPEQAADDHLPPVLRNPELAEPDETPLMPRHVPQAVAPPAPEPSRPVPPAGNAGPAPGWRAPPPLSPPQQPSYFDAMWPSEARSPKEPAAELGAGSSEASRRETVMRESVVRETVVPRRPEPAKQAAETRPAPVPVLKSGVIDGMGYTLYVDGSIEAELPDGTLRFGSIGELREHLEKNS